MTTIICLLLLCLPLLLPYCVALCQYFGAVSEAMCYGILDLTAEAADACHLWVQLLKASLYPCGSRGYVPDDGGDGGGGGEQPP